VCIDLMKFKGEVPMFISGTGGVSLRRDRRYMIKLIRSWFLELQMMQPQMISLRTSSAHLHLQLRP
jgi:hypothetical protein